MTPSPDIMLENDLLVVKLPLTSPTGKIRVKRKTHPLDYGSPVATRQQSFCSSDYVEWQISYFTHDPDHKSAVPGVVINGSTGCELTKILHLAIKGNIISLEEIRKIKQFIADISPTDTLQENTGISRQDMGVEAKGGFKKIVEKVPIFIKENKDMGYFVEIKLAHKQRAVGLQAMVYLCVYVNKLRDLKNASFMGRTAEKKEQAILTISRENRKVILDTLMAFGVASWQHRKDMLELLHQIENLS